MRQIRQWLFVTALFSWCGLAWSADTVITFDDIAADTLVDTQYVSKGVEFRAPPFVALPPPSQIPQGTCCAAISRAAVPNHAGQVLAAFVVREFWTASLFAAFSDFHRHVDVTVGQFNTLGTAQVSLSAYDVAGVPIGSPATTTLGAEPQTLSVASPSASPNIAYVLVQTSDLNKALWIDDLTFDTASPGAGADFQFERVGDYPGQPLQIPQGVSRSFPIQLRRFNGSNGDITLRLPGVPAGVSGSFSPNPVSGTNTAATMTLAASAGSPAVTDAPITVLGQPAGPSAGPMARSAQSLLTVRRPFEVTLSGAGASYDLLPCTPTSAFPVYVLKSPDAVAGDVRLAARVDDGSGGTRPLPGFLAANLEPDVSAQGQSFTVHDLTLSFSGGSARQLIPVLVEGSDGSTSVDSKPLFVQIIDTTSVSGIGTTFASIPNSILGRAGTQVVFFGSAFCPGAKVQFGKANPLGLVDADSVTQGRIVATVPRYATADPSVQPDINVFEPGYSVTLPSLPFFVDSIRNTVGFSFHNYTPHTTFGQLTAAYGSDQTEDDIPLCWPFDCVVTVHDPNALIWLNFLKSFTDVSDGGGACYGNSLATQRLLSGQKDRHEFSPPTAVTNFDLDGPAGPSAPLEEYINSQDTVQISLEYLNDYLAQSYLNSLGKTADVMREIRSRIRDALSGGEKPLIALRYGGLNGHLVLAYDIEDVSSDPLEYWIDVWDTNLPFDRSRENQKIEVHLENVLRSRIHVAPDGTWSLLSTTATGFINGLIVTRPSDIPLHPTLPGSLGAELSHLGGLTIFGSNSTGSRGGSSSRVVQMSNEAGQTLFDAQGLPNEDARSRLKAAPFAPFVNRGAKGQMFLVAPDAGPVFQEVRGTGSGSSVQLMARGGLTARVEAKTARDVSDLVGFHPNGTVSFASRSDREKPVKIGLMAHGQGFVKAAELETTSARGSLTDLRFDEARSGVTAHAGDRAAPLRLRLSNLARKGGPISFDSGIVTVPPGSTVTFTPADWTALDTVLMTVLDAQGHQQQRVLGNRGGKPDAGRFVLDVDRSRKEPHRWRIDALADQKLHAEGVQSWIAFIVRRGAVIVGHTVQPIEAPARHSGDRRLGRFEFLASEPGRYDVEATLTIRNDQGVISEVRRTVRAAHFVQRH